MREATAPSATQTVGTIEVRLALHVLRLYGCEQALLTGFWRAAIAEPRHVWTSCLIPHRHIAQRLIDLGATVDEENRS